MFENEEELTQLREKIREMPDEEVLQMATSDASQYRQEAVDFAIAELTRRGYVIEPYDPAGEADDDLKDAVMKYQTVRGPSTDREALLSQAAEIATELGESAVINISHSVAGEEDLIVIWYWLYEDNEEV